MLLLSPASKRATARIKTVNNLKILNLKKMKKFKLVAFAMATAATLNLNAQKMELKTKADSISYAIGVSIANNLKSGGFEGLNSDLISTAMSQVFKGQPTAIDAESANKMIQDHVGEVQAQKGVASKGKGEKFLAENKTKKGVIILPDGLQYEILTAGTGPKPAATDKVKVHYHGTLTDGTVFDSSVQRGQPAEFGVNQVIKGWTEALQLMNTGSKWKLVIPSDLAYGDRGAGGQIGPNEVLVFEVELLSIEKEAPATK